MAPKKFPATLQSSATAVQEEGDDRDLNYALPKQTSTESDLRMLVEEVAGQGSPDGFTNYESSEVVEAHEEVSGEGAEAGEEFAEASPEQLSSSTIESDNVYSDLRGIEGFEEVEGQESGETEARAAMLPDAGSGVYGNQEFLPILAALASSVIPTLVSKIGPKVASGVVKKLAPRALNLLKSRKKLAGPIGVIARLLESAEQQPAESFGTESGEEVDAVVQEAAATIEAIIGADDRVRINNTRKVPWRRICALRISMPKGTYVGTGFFIGPRVLVTAGHCVYMQGQGWAKSIVVIPGCSDNDHPFGEVTATSFHSVKGWLQDKKPECDYGCIVLPLGAFGGQSLGSFGFGSFPASELLATPAILAGYPGDKPFAQLWGMKRKVKAVAPTQLMYDIDTYGGQSGSPVFIKKGGKRYVVGIHNYGAATGNSATRITPAVFQNLKAWRALGSSQSTTQPKASGVAA